MEKRVEPEELPESQPKRPSEKRFWSSDKFLSLLAFLISIGTFFTFAYQTYLIQKQQYANTRPHLRIDLGNDYDSSGISSMNVVLINNGVGPAFIQSVKMYQQDSVYAMDPAAFVYQFADPDSVGARATTYRIGPGDVVPAGDRWTLLKFDDPYLIKLGQRLDQESSIEIVYSSIYDEKWKYRQPLSSPADRLGLWAVVVLN